MVISTKQNLATKELFNRADIRTMKKDLKKLREADSLKEREKIKGGNPKLQAPNKSQISTEQTKEQIFLAKSEKTQLEKELQDAPAKPVAVAVKTNVILEEEKQLQAKLGAMTAEEEKIEQEAATAPQNQRDALEEKQQEMEKKRWQQEQELQKKHMEELRLAQVEKQRMQKENDAKAKVAEIENSLKSMQEDVAKKEAVKVAPQAPKPATPQGNNAELAQRKKFLEDVEAWASTSEKDN